MDFIFTLVAIYLAYRGYQWYTNVQRQVKGPKRRPPLDITPEEREEDNDDFIDYEEVK
jgi:hypothetical protein